MLKKLGLTAVVLILGAAVWAAIQIGSIDNRVAEAETLVGEEQWREARRVLRPVFRWQPAHAQANMLMAEALIRDDLLVAPGDEQAGMAIVDEALAHLARIPDDSPLANEALVKAASLEALVRLHPSRGLELLRRAIEINPQNQEAYYLFWKINELVGRPHMVVDEVWQAIELAPEERRGELLREWYMGEFYATTANEQLERQMGLLGPDATPDDKSTAERYLVFIRQEPKSTLGYVALARWFASSGAPRDCLMQLDEAIKNADQPLQDPLLVSTLIHALDDLGRADQTGAYFQDWPGEKDGYDYWRAKALVEHKVRKNLPLAIEAYREAINHWPGQIDWRTWNLLANCLRENGQAEEAAQVAERSNEIERLMHADIQSTLRSDLALLDNPERLSNVVKFYRELNMNRAADAWQTIVEKLESKENKETQNSD